MTDRPPTVSAVRITGIALATVLVPLNSTMIAVALPSIAREFDIPKGQTGLLVTVYLAAMLLGQPVAGRLADAVGPHRLAVLAVAGFGVFSAAALFAGSFPILVGLRVGQAAFASALTPSVQSMLRLVTGASERGRAFGLQGMVIGAGAGMGPVVGGLAVSAFGWRSIFGVNLPIVALVLVVLGRVPRAMTSPAEPDTATPRDATALPEATGGDGPHRPNQDRGERLTNRVFVAAFSTQALSTFAQYTLLLITPILLDDRGWSAGAIGLGLSALTLGMIVMSTPGGRLGDRLGRRTPVVGGLAACLVAVAATAAFGDDPTSWLLIVSLLVFGLGLGTATPGVITSGMEAAPEHRIGLGSGLMSMSRYVGSIVASVVLTVTVDDQAHGVGLMLLLCTVAVGASLVAARRLPSSPPSSRSPADRSPR